MANRSSVVIHTCRSMGEVGGFCVFADGFFGRKNFAVDCSQSFVPHLSLLVSYNCTLSGAFCFFGFFGRGLAVWIRNVEVFVAEIFRQKFAFLYDYFISVIILSIIHDIWIYYLFFVEFNEFGVMHVVYFNNFAYFMICLNLYNM